MSSLQGRYNHVWYPFSDLQINEIGLAHKCSDRDSISVVEGYPQLKSTFGDKYFTALSFAKDCIPGEIHQPHQYSYYQANADFACMPITKPTTHYFRVVAQRLL